MGRLAGFTAAAVAAISFNFFHTQPYLTLRIKEGQDVVTVLLLLVVGLVVGELALLRRRTRHEVVAQATGAHVLEDVLALLAADSTVDADLDRGARRDPDRARRPARPLLAGRRLAPTSRC